LTAGLVSGGLALSFVALLFVFTVWEVVAEEEWEWVNLFKNIIKNLNEHLECF
jgi:hypothetical protein